MHEKDFYLGFSVFPGIGPAKFQLLLNTFASAKNAWEADEKKLTSVLEERLVMEFADFRTKFSPDRYANKLEEQQIGWICSFEDDYPQSLKTVNRPPFVLFYKGNKTLLKEQKTIAIVGTRMISQYGREVTAMLTAQLVDENFIIVSGLALGVDGVAHETCLKNNGKTIAVLGSGVDVCTPVNHQKLYDAIIEQQSLIVSTVPPGEKPNKGSFPARNKIIAGLSLGTIVTEGAADSGALYTADFARKMARPVFAIPGPITSRLSAATSKLLKEGAVLITNAQDIVDTLGIMSLENKPKVQKEVISSSPEEQQILDLLKIESLHFNEIVRKIGKDSRSLGSLLSVMELKGLIRSSGEVYFI